MSDAKPTFTPPSGSRERFRPTTPRPLLVEIAFWVLLGTEAVRVGWVVVAPRVHSLSGYLFALGSSVFFVLVALLVRRGIGWARVVTTVVSLAAVFVIPISVALAEQVHPLDTVLDVADLAATAMLWLPNSRAFFRSVATEHSVYRARQLG